MCGKSVSVCAAGRGGLVKAVKALMLLKDVVSLRAPAAQKPAVGQEFRQL